MKRKLELLLDTLASNIISWSIGFIALVAFIVFITMIFQDSIILGVLVTVVFISNWIGDFRRAIKKDKQEEEKQWKN